MDRIEAAREAVLQWSRSVLALRGRSLEGPAADGAPLADDTASGEIGLVMTPAQTAGWWLHSRWSALREAQEARREAELMMVFEARSNAKEKPAAQTPAASDFYPTLPEQAQQQAQTAKRGAPLQARRPRETE